jgi:hypothetical protein
MLTYEEWMRKVDVIVAAKCGLPMDCLPDWLSRDNFEDGVSPEEGAEICLEQVGFYEYEGLEPSDADALASAGWGTDEDYGLYDEA